MRAKLSTAILLFTLSAGSLWAQGPVPFAASAAPPGAGYARDLYPLPAVKPQPEYQNRTQLEFRATLERLPARIGDRLSEMLDRELTQDLQALEADGVAEKGGVSTN